MRVALLKGRSSYLCCARPAWRAMQWEKCRRSRSVCSQRLKRVTQHPQRGDLSELTGLTTGRPSFPGSLQRMKPPGQPLPQCQDATQNQPAYKPWPPICGGQPPPVFCRHGQARVGGSRALPSVVFDEAHQLSDAGLQFLGIQLSTGQFVEFARDALSALSGAAPVAMPIGHNLQRRRRGLAVMPCSGDISSASSGKARLGTRCARRCCCT